MSEKNPIRLLRKYLFGKPDSVDSIRVDKWYDSVEDSEESVNETVKEALYQRTWESIQQSPPLIPLYKRPIFRFSIAAVLVLGMIAIWFVFAPSRQLEVLIAEQPITPKQDVAPPADTRAILELADGRIIVLDSAGSGSLATQGDALVSKLSADKIAYIPLDQESGQPTINTLRVPRGSRPIQLQLSDGSTVWLNVGSSITYPSYFTGGTRSVQMTGEAYFDISHDASRPFLVQRGSTKVEVLGTQFNVNGYEDEAAIKVTLLQGAVEVQQAAGDKLKISPGQQAVVTAASDIRLKKEVDLEEVMAWKNGWFYFNRLSLPEIMRQLEKWYDVDVEYEGSKTPKKFSGMVNRNNNLSEVLKLMEMAGIRFRITNKKIYVMQ